MSAIPDLGKKLKSYKNIKRNNKKDRFFSGTDIVFVKRLFVVNIRSVEHCTPRQKKYLAVESCIFC